MNDTLEHIAFRYPTANPETLQTTHELQHIEVAGKSRRRAFLYWGPSRWRLKRDGGSQDYEVLYLHTTHNGSASVVTDSAGAVVERQEFDPFGRRRSLLWSTVVSPMTGDEADLDIGFTGHRKVEDHGLIDMGGRHYDPHLGRFASPDPVLAAPGSSQGYDPFAYVYNDPLSFTDPSGFTGEPVQVLDSLRARASRYFDSTVFGEGQVDLIALYSALNAEIGTPGGDAFISVSLGETVVVDAESETELGGSGGEDSELIRERIPDAGPPPPPPLDIPGKKPNASLEHPALSASSPDGIDYWIAGQSLGVALAVFDISAGMFGIVRGEGSGTPEINAAEKSGGYMATMIASMVAPGVKKAPGGPQPRFDAHVRAYRALPPKVKSLKHGASGTTARVKSKAEADALLKEAFSDYKKVRGVGPQDASGAMRKRKMEVFKEGGAYHKDYAVDPATGRARGHKGGNPHGDYPYINIKRRDGANVTIDIIE